MNILITGASGFLGKAILDCDYIEKHAITVLQRKYRKKNIKTVNQVICNNLSSILIPDNANYVAFKQTLENVDVVIHAAAQVHIQGGSLEKYSEINTIATKKLARLSAECGVKRFVFISSIKVNGELTQAEQSFSPNDKFTPTDPYALSKYEAEKGLLEIAKETGMEVVIIRPPLVYGPNVKANFASIVKLIKKGIPLPFGRVENKRSLVALDNLVSFIMLCMEHPKAANEIFLISDGEDVSTTTLLRRIANAYEKRAWLVPIPVSWMTAVAKVFGKEDKARRLFGNLQVDSSKARDLLGWKPVVTMDEQLKKMADAEK